MELPKRIDAHVMETASWRLLQSLAPKEWIIREVSERDYGVDCYIEIASEDGYITGDLISAQLKSVESAIGWSESEKGTRVARSPSIAVSTATYWFKMPVPVFLFVADLETQDIYFVAVKDAIRDQYDKLEAQKSISFKLSDGLNLKSRQSMKLLGDLYERERQHDQFSFHVANLISQLSTFGNFIGMNQNRDIFMEVEAEQHLQFRALYQACRMISLYRDGKWPVESLEDLYAMDRREWKDQHVYLHEKTLDYALQKIEKLFPELARWAIELVTEKQLSYWSEKDPVFFQLCAGGDLEWELKRFEHDAGLIPKDGR